MSTVKSTQANMQTVRVELKDRSYDILIGRGILEQSCEKIAQIRPGGRVAIITDETVNSLYADICAEAMIRAGLMVSRSVITPGEASKSYDNFARVCDDIISARVERGDLVVALGGGVVGDLSGFAASAVRRGVKFVQIPTTLLSQVDSSVGGKTGINSSHGKNLVGAFYQPSLVIADTALLDTLPPRELRAGYAEVVKYGLIDNAAFFNWCEANWQGIFQGSSARDDAVATSCRSKAAIVARDEHEIGDRALLNLGHTFAHAFERLTNYDGTRLVHGEAVSIGIAMAFRLSVRLELCPQEEATRVLHHLETVGLPTHISNIAGEMGNANIILDAMMQDKKVSRGALTLILAKGIGKSYIEPGIASSDVKSFLEFECKAR